MPSIVRTTSSHKSTPSKQKFRTVLGVFKDQDHTTPAAATLGRDSTLTRQSIDTPRSYTGRRKHRVDPSHSSVTEISFFQADRTTVPSDQPPVIDLASYDMDMPRTQSAHRRPPVRMDAQDGPWSISVAETPHDARAYSLYIKTPTHNLTLTRTAMEIVDLHQKLGESHPGVKLPALPLDAAALPTPPPTKRKSTFLNTLSRLASPASAKSTRRLNNSSAIPSPSPSQEITDPFLSFSHNGDASVLTPVTSPTATSTGLASYFTTISNTPALRQARVWKRFVRVRTDDLESVRVERAIKRVRSDLAVHGSSKFHDHSAVSSNGSASVAPSADESEDEMVNGTEDEVEEDDSSVAPFREDGIQEEEEEEHTVEADATPVMPSEPNGVSDEDKAEITPIETETKPVDDEAEEDVPSTPLATDPPHNRMHRSQSADPDKSSRLSRVYTSSVSTPDGTSSQTDNESSVSTTGTGRRVARKKRSRSSEPNKEKKKSHRKVVIDDFEMMRVLGKGCAGKVLLVRHKSTTDLYALKAITKRHVLAHQELQHTLTEQAVLKRMAAESKDPFVVKLWWSFHDKENLFLVMDFHPGGDLATQLARWGRLGRDRARFYAAEIVEGVEGLHAAGVIYRDLKPENILIGADGHIVLTDFGLSKEFPRRTSAITAPSTPSGIRGGEFYSSVPGTPQPTSPPWMIADKTGEMATGWPGQPVGQGDSTTTFCGTAEYLAPEVIQGLPYSYEVDWWSFGTMLYEMLTGITPFWANNHSDMYVRVLQDELQFPDDRAIDQDTKSLIRGLLQRNPALRMCEPRIKRHPYFSMIDWSHVYYKRYIPPYIPPIDPLNASDTQNFDDTFLDMEPVLDDVNDNEQTDTDQEREQTDTDRTDDESNTTPSQSRSSSIHPQQRAAEDDSVDVFDGYSFKGRYSVLMDDEDEEEEDEEEEEEEEEEESEEDIKGTNVLSEIAPEAPKASVVEDELSEPKTPEARPHPLPEETLPEVKDGVISEAPTPAESVRPLSAVLEAKPRKSKEQPAPETTEVSIASVAKEVRAKEAKEAKAKEAKEAKTKEVKTKTAPPAKAPTTRPAANRLSRPPRREKSGVPALDRYLSDTIDEDVEATEKEDDEDDDWDFVEAADGEDRNGAKGNSLFARGVVDRYRLAVFRKASTPSQRMGPRTFSGLSKESTATVSETAESPSPSQRRGRNQGLTFRKNPRQFLQPKSPPSTYSTKSSGTAKSLNKSNSATLSATSTVSSTGLLTPSPSQGSSLPMSPSLKSKESAISVGTQSFSSDQSGNGDAATAEVVGGPSDTVKGGSKEEPEKYKNKKLKKYKENAEKVFSLFSSPRQPS